MQWTWHGSKDAFIICCNAAALHMYRLLIYCRSTQRTTPQVHFLSLPQGSSRRRERNTTAAIYRNVAAVDNERTLRESYSPHVQLQINFNIIAGIQHSVVGFHFYTEMTTKDAPTASGRKNGKLPPPYLPDET